MSGTYSSKLECEMLLLHLEFSDKNKKCALQPLHLLLSGTPDTASATLPNIPYFPISLSILNQFYITKDTCS